MAIKIKGPFYLAIVAKICDPFDHILGVFFWVDLLGIHIPKECLAKFHDVILTQIYADFRQNLNQSKIPKNYLTVVYNITKLSPLKKFLGIVTRSSQRLPTKVGAEVSLLPR